MIIHILSDGRVTETIENHVVQSKEVYELLDKIRKEKQ